MRDTFLGVIVTTVVILPMAVLGAAAPFLRADLGLGEGALGLLVGLYFLTGTLASMPAGRLSVAMRLDGLMIAACAVAAGVLLGVALIVGSWWALALLLAAGGVANAAGQVSANQWLARHRPMNRQGIAFGAKQAAVPLASLGAGLLLPVVIVPHGWRAGFGVAAAIAIAGIVAVAVMRGRGTVGLSSDGTPGVKVLRLPYVALTAVAFMGAAGGTCMAPFLVDYATSRGMSADAAGLLLAAGAASGIGARLLAGLAADAFDLWPLSMIGGMLLVGGVGIGLLAVASTGLIWVPAVVLAFAGAWGWPGLLPLALSRASTEAFRSGVGMIVMGQLAGAVAGPPIFGLVVEGAGYPVGWSMLVAFVVSAAGLALALRLRAGSLHPAPRAALHDPTE